VARGNFLCMVKGVQVYGESHDDTHAMKISDTSFDEATRTSGQVPTSPNSVRSRMQSSSRTTLDMKSEAI
jgi:hypothetical protein